jgi:hypothetical protein
MKRCFTVALVLAGCLAATPWLCAQTPAAASGQGQPAAGGQQKAVQPESGANPFPTDTNEVPVLRPNGAPDGADSGDNLPPPLPDKDLDPARSPDDSGQAEGSAQSQDVSSSLTGLAGILPKADDTPPGKGKKNKDAVAEPVHPETATEDINVGQYYLDNKNWSAAQSRFQSALMLDPEEPDVYWGLAESARHLGDFSSARKYYEKVAEYDPGSRHGKDAMKALREPEIANAKASSPAQPSAASPK